MHQKNYFNLMGNFLKLITISFILLICTIFLYRTFLNISFSEASIEELSTIYKGIILNPFELFLKMRSDSHPPLYYLTVNIFSKFLPKNVYGIRLISWFFYIASGILISIFTFLASKKFNPKNAIYSSTISGLIFFINPLTVEYSSDGKMYTFLCFSISLTLFIRYFTLKVDKFKNLSNQYFIYSLSVCLLSLIHYFGVIYAFSLVFIDFVLERKKRLLKNQIFALIPVSIWIILFNFVGFIKNSNSKKTFLEFNFIGVIKQFFLGNNPLIFLTFILIVFLISIYKKSFYKSSKFFEILNYSGIFATILTFLISIILSFKLSILHSRFFIYAVPSIAISQALILSNIGRKKYIDFYSLAFTTFLVFQFWNHSFYNLNKYSLAGSKRASLYNSYSTYEKISLNTYKYKSRYTVFPVKHMIATEFLMRKKNLIPENVKPFEPYYRIEDSIYGKSKNFTTRLRETIYGAPKNLENKFVVAVNKKKSKLEEFKKLKKDLFENDYICTSLKDENEFAIYECNRN